MKALSVSCMIEMELVVMWKEPNEELWKGRADAEASSVRFHQAVNCQLLSDLPPAADAKTFSFIGFTSDEGVRRNQGRIGAADAPNVIRSYVANLPFHERDVHVYDVGNVACEDGDLERAQRELGKGVSKILENNTTPIIIGGGHETVYGHYLGVRAFVGKDKSIGIINIDAHFDLRDDDAPSSGTMFSQIFANDDKVGYLCLGIQRFGNTQALFDAADRVGCTYVFAEDIEKDETYEIIDEFSEKYDVLLLTLCSDVIASSSAPGVSAPAPYGLEPRTVRAFIRYIAKKEHTISFDLCEVNPLVDVNDQTSRLAALLLADAIAQFSTRDRTAGETLKIGETDSERRGTMHD